MRWLCVVLSLCGCASNKPSSPAPPVAPRPTAVVRLVGHGLSLTPLTPRGVVQMANGNVLVGPMNPALGRRDGVKNAAVMVGRAPTRALSVTGEGEQRTYGSGEEGASRILLGAGVNVEDLFSSAQRGGDGPWRIATDSYEVPYPGGLTLRIDAPHRPRAAPWELSLGGSSEELVQLSGPLTGAKEIPTPEHLTAPGMTRVAQGQLPGVVNTVVWFELTYEHGGEKWRQRFHYVPIDAESVYLLRTQVLEANAPTLFSASDDMAQRFTPTR